MNFENEMNSIEAFEFLRISNSLEFSNALSKHTLSSQPVWCNENILLFDEIAPQQVDGEIVLLELFGP
ncbi:hypothetical protein MTR_4g027310 [Medicago truncatula]|uniref:Uncharacterized protein n=1 Tax=Medicago truncatula TaxID=3880 RepID=A0A072UHL6_MEDTR|nr:hypothetical protein MTR_4g027310 [Medicago truncatula]